MHVKKNDQNFTEHVHLFWNESLQNFLIDCQGDKEYIDDDSKFSDANH